AVPHAREVARGGDHALAHQEPGGELEVVPGRPHGDGDRPAVHPDLQRLLGGEHVHPVGDGRVAHPHHPAADGDPAHRGYASFAGRFCTCWKPNRPLMHRLPWVTGLSCGEVTLTIRLSCTCSVTLQPTPQ